MVLPAPFGPTSAQTKRPRPRLLDEPVAALDPLARRNFLATLTSAVADAEGSVPKRLVLVTVPAEFCVRRVGFRAGTDEELTALHAVETPIAAERGSNRMPQPAGSYIAFAHKLPSQFNDHAWLVEASDGTPVAAGFCWSNSAGDHRVMECDLFVRRDHRHQGIGSRLLATICNETVNEGRSLLIWPTFGAVPAGDASLRDPFGTLERETCRGFSGAYRKDGPVRTLSILR